MTQPASPIRIGLIGYGYAGKTFHVPLIRSTPGLELAAVASSDATRVHADLPGMWVIDSPSALIRDERIDVVVIATPNHTHAPLASETLRAGKHVVLGKPMALDLAEARELIALADASPGLLSVFHNRRWDSDYLAVKHAIADGAIGEVVHFESHIDRFRPVVRNRWRESAGPGAGIWYDLGPHLVDQALQLFGLPERVQAHLAIQRSGGKSDDWAHVRLDYGHRQVILHASMLVAGGARRFVVHGSRGSLVKVGADRQEAQLIDGLRPGTQGWGEDPDPLQLFDADGRRHDLPTLPGDQGQYYAALRDAVQNGQSHPVTPLQALAVMAVLEAGFESARCCSNVTVSLSDAEREGIQENLWRQPL